MNVNGNFFKRLLQGVALGAAAGIAAASIACGNGKPQEINQTINPTPHVVVEATVAILKQGSSISYKNISLSNESSQDLFLIRGPIERAYNECGIPGGYDIRIVFNDADNTRIKRDQNSLSVHIGTLGVAEYTDRLNLGANISPIREAFLKAYGQALSNAVYGAVCIGGYVGKPDFEINAGSYLKEIDSRLQRIIPTLQPVYYKGIPCYIACSPELPEGFTPRSLR